MEGTAVLGTGALGGGSASFMTSALNAGTNSITAVYGGDSNFAGSTSPALTQKVNKAGSSVSVVSSKNPAAFGATVTFTAALESTPWPKRCSGSGTPTGMVTFKNGGATLGTGMLSGGKASFSTAKLAVGSHSITAVYGGDGNFNPSTSAVLKQTITKAATTASVVSSKNPSISGKAVTFTATVESTTTGTPTGTVTFKNGGATLGTRTLSGGEARYTTSTLAVGSHSITAVYGGSTSYSGSTSPPLTQKVNP